MTAGRATQVLGATASGIALVVLPALIVGKPAAEPAPATGALVVQLTGEEGGKTPFAVKLDGTGTPKAARLRDTTGLHTGRVVPEEAPSCAAAKPRTVFGKGPGWCLTLQHVAAGSELTGTVTSSDKSTLTLTVHRRDAFDCGVLLVMIAGFVCGFLVALVPRALGTLVRKIVLHELVSKQGKDIAGLAEWVRKREAEGEDREDVIAAAYWAGEHGGAVADAARTDLQAAIDAARAAGVTHPLVDEAQTVAAADGVRMEDLYDGMERRSHPAELQTAAVVRLTQIQQELAAQARVIATLHDPDLDELLGHAGDVLAGISAIDQLSRMDAPLEALATAVAAARVAGRPVVEAAGREDGDGAVAPARAAPRGALLSILTPTLTGKTLQTWAWIARLLTLAVIVIVLAYAFVTVKDAAYDGKPLFHDFSDYLSLFAAALASGAAGTTLALLGYWRPGTSFTEA